MFGRKLCRREIRIGFLLIALALLCTAASAITIDGHTFTGGASHVINGVSGTNLTYHQMTFVMNNSTGTSNGNVIYTNGQTQSDWRDIRFTDANNVVYPYYIESTNATAANVWVNITSIPSTGITMNVYWNSTTAPSASDGVATFPLFDTFDTINTTKWYIPGSSSVSNSVLSVTNSAGNMGIVNKETSFGNCIIEHRSRSGVEITTLSRLSANTGDTFDVTGVCHWMSQSGYEMILEVKNGGSTGSQASIDVSQYRYRRLVMVGQTMTAYRFADGNWATQEATATLTSATMRTTGYTGIRSFSGRNILVDWFRVRDYVATEPTQGSYTPLFSPPIAAFGTNVTGGYAPLPVQFTDQSTNSPTAWSWDFGDGQTSTEQNPTHLFSDIGTYTVSLTATNTYGSDDESKTGYITVNSPPPVTAFTANQSIGKSPLVVQFTDQSTNSPTAWSWTFGDGQTSTEQNPTHTFTALGSYTVSLTATNAIGSDDETKIDYISVIPAAPVAAFSAGPIAGAAPLTVSFVDTSTGTPTSWAWDFTEDGTADSVEQNPTHIYAANGTYSVTLQVSNSGGTDIITKTDLIYVGPLTANYLKASFRYTGVTGAEGSAPYAVTFTDTTRTDGGTYAREWDFGDGETSTEANPTHVYTDSGKFDVGLSVHSATRTNSVGYKKIINIYPKTAITPLPTNTYGAHMTQIMETDFNIKNVSEIIQIIPMAYTDVIPPTLFWGMLFITAFFMMFVRQGTPWLIGLLAILIGGEITVFTAPEWQMLGWGMMAVSLGGFLYVLYKGRYRSD